MMAALVYHSRSRFTVLLALNGRYVKASEYLNCLHFGSYFHRINPQAAAKRDTAESLLKLVESFRSKTLEIDVPSIADELEELIGWLG